MVLKVFVNVSEKFKPLAKKLSKARSGGIIKKSVSGNRTVELKKKTKKRTKKCRLCKSTQHSTPKYRKGNVKYKR